MSICIPIDNLTPPQKLSIKEDLWVVEKLSKSAPEFAQPKKIRDFFIDGETRIAYIPYAYARNKLDVKIHPRAVSPIKFHGCLRDYQKIPIAETITNIKEHGSAILSAYCGFGKTITSLYIASHIGGPVAILAHRNNLISQWKEAIDKFIEGPVDIISVHTVKNMNKQELAKYNFIIVDEAHVMCASTFTEAMLCFEPSFALGLSATPSRPDGMDVILDNHFNRKLMTVVKKEKAVDIRVYYTGIIPEFKENKSGGIDWNSVVNYLAENEEVNQLIIQQLLQLSEKRFMILCARKTQIKLLEQLCIENEIDVTTYYESMKGPKNPSARVLIGTVSKLGVGFDDTTRNALIFGCDVANIENLEQYTGRVIHRTKDVPLIIDFVHDFTSLKRHWTTRKKFYENIGGDLQMIGFPSRMAAKPKKTPSFMKRPGKNIDPINETMVVQE